MSASPLITQTSPSVLRTHAAHSPNVSPQEYEHNAHHTRPHGARYMATVKISFKLSLTFHLQSLGIPRYSFRHSLQTQTLAVHMRPGAAALVWASSHRGSAQQQRQNKSPNPAERRPRLGSDRRHDYPLRLPPTRS